MPTGQLLEIALVISLVLLVLLVVVALLYAHRRGHAAGLEAGRESMKIDFIPGHRVVEQGWWLWRKYELFATVQYTLGGVPIGQPVERPVKTVSEVDEAALKEAIDIAMALATQNPVPLAVKRAAKQFRQGTTSAEDAYDGEVEPDPAATTRTAARTRTRR